MQCHIKIPGQYACEEEGTHCPPCACWFCDHVVNLVCAIHHEWLEGVMTGWYQAWELWEHNYPQEAAKMDEDERFDPENFSIMYEILHNHLVMDNHIPTAAQGKNNIAAGISAVKSGTTTYWHDPTVVWPPPMPEEYRKA